MLEVDGSYGEGGGQILRTGLTLSVVKGRPVHFSNIRAGREVPGLRRQHVGSLKALAAVFDCSIQGAEVGSSEVTFVPGPPRARSVSLDMGTAASITLVLQAVVPAASLVGSGISLELVGGTDVPWSPTLDYYSLVVGRALGAIGIEFTVRAERRGYYPVGGGKVMVEVTPCPKPRPLRVLDAPPRAEASVISRCSRLPKSVAERQLQSASAALESEGVRVGERGAYVEEADSPGSSVLVSTTTDSVFLGSDELGAKGKAAEVVGAEAAGRFVTYVRAGSTVDDNLADMLAPILSLVPGRSELRAASESEHLSTSMYVARLFTGCRYEAVQEGGGVLIMVEP